MRAAPSLVLLALGLTVPLGPAAAQQHWSWPEKAENLKVLPADTPKEQLQQVMHSFTDGLGVRCTHCHVAKEGVEEIHSLSDIDFPSDASPNKDTARLMMKMVGAINDDWLSKVKEDEGETKVTMSCNTCHRGLPRPISLQTELSAVYAKDGIDSTVAKYQDLREKFYGSGSFDFGEGSLNELGYELLQGDHAADAVTVFKLNAEEFPESGNVWDSLGEGWLAVGDRDQAISCYEKAVELDPRNRNAAAQLEKLRSGE